jgi:exodeoxyribonuclease III
MPLTLATVNVNGIRAAARKGMVEWLQQSRADVIALQEVRAPLAEVEALVSAGHFGAGAQLWLDEASAKGRAGVAIISSLPALAVRTQLGADDFDSAGRWLEVDFETRAGVLTVVSCYVHSGEADTPKQVEKYKFLEAMTKRMSELRAQDGLAAVVGDLNVGHTELDIKNWKGNLKNAGFLPEERAYFDGFMNGQGWVDLGRAAHPDEPGPYTWWSYRGQAFDTDAGWRIDYQLATPKLAALAANYRIDRAPSYAERWSDHAPVVVDYDL